MGECDRPFAGSVCKTWTYSTNSRPGLLSGLDAKVCKVVHTGLTGMEPDKQGDPRFTIEVWPLVREIVSGTRGTMECGCRKINKRRV
jgi:hypothetical protein